MLLLFCYQKYTTRERPESAWKVDSEWWIVKSKEKKKKEHLTSIP